MLLSTVCDKMDMQLDISKKGLFDMNEVKVAAYPVEKKKLSMMRKNYIARLIGRCLVLLLGIAMCMLKPEAFEIINGWNFFQQFSVLHLLWGVWMMDMLFQLIPMKGIVPLGSQKLFQKRFVAVKGNLEEKRLREHIAKDTKKAYQIFLVWTVMIAILGGLRHMKIISDRILFMISVFFYVCDLICVLIWCPFRVFMQNRCCTTCRIFNWDHAMMFTPLLFVEGFYAKSLVVMAFAVWVLWEYSVMVAPERFWDGSNAALKCSNCTDKLCTQYCAK